MIVLKDEIIALTESLHRRMFVHEMSEEMRRFLKNLSWSFGAGMFAAGIMFFVSILAGRLLGPLEFGKYNYILSLATSLTFFFLLGNNQSSIRYISDKKYSEKISRFLGAFLFLILIQSIVVFLVSFFLKDLIIRKTGIDNETTFYLIVFLGFVFSAKELFDSFIRSMGFFKRQSLVKAGESLIVLVVFLLFFLVFHEKLTYLHYAWSMMIGAVFSLAIFFYFIRDRFDFFGRAEVVSIFHYNKFLILGGFSGLIMSLEKVFIGKYVGIESLGVYSAYYGSSQMIISNLAILFMGIFWPTVIKNKDNLEPVINKLTKVFFRYFPMWAVMNFLSISFFLFLYGKQYPVYISLLVLFSLSSLLNIFFFVYMSLLNIDKISHAILINTIVYIVLVSSVMIFKNISIYLITQIAVYLCGIIYVRNNLIRHYCMGKNI